MGVSAKVIAHSVSLADIRLVTVQCRYPKFIHGEVMTHRVFSRNASSSRAIPVERLIQDVLDDPAMPIHWGKNQKGMQARAEHDAPVDCGTREAAWLKARANAVEMALAFSNAGYHKQIVNRLLEPFYHINTLISATEWNNFFALRDHEDAQPEIRELAAQIKQAMAESEPTLLQPGEWHLPYVTEDEWRRGGLSLDQAKMVSVARCARVSYMTQEGKKPSIEQDLALYDRLVGSAPLHASPAEHQATPDRFDGNLKADDDRPDAEGSNGTWRFPSQHGNFRGWRQYRKFLPNEVVR
jgi:thymidylate synthase ThyX